MPELSRRAFLGWVAASSLPLIGGIGFQKTFSRSNSKVIHADLENRITGPQVLQFNIHNGEPVCFFPQKRISISHIVVHTESDMECKFSSHNCLLMKLKAPKQFLLSYSAKPGFEWHIDNSLLIEFSKSANGQGRLWFRYV